MDTNVGPDTDRLYSLQEAAGLYIACLLSNSTKQDTVALLRNNGHKEPIMY